MTEDGAFPEEIRESVESMEMENSDRIQENKNNFWVGVCKETATPGTPKYKKREKKNQTPKSGRQKQKKRLNKSDERNKRGRKRKRAIYSSK